MAAKPLESARTHLVNPLWDGNGGADRRTVDTWRLLQPSGNVYLWSEYAPAPQFASNFPIRRIAPLQLEMPFGGTIVFIGVYFRVGHWIRFARPDRVIVLYNTDQPDRLAKNLRRIAGCGRPAEVVASSHELARRVGLELPLLESPIDLFGFLGTNRPARSTFTVGRLSRDVEYKHHDEDPALYRLLAAAGCRVRIMGGTCLANKLAGIPNIELLPAGAESAVEFLRSLDCFVYRTSARWFEGFGRVVFEAMASGLPVVCSATGGYAEYLRNGHDCLFFGSTAEAASAILGLRADSALRRQLGSSAMASASTTIGSARERTRDFLLPSFDSVSHGSASVTRRAPSIIEH